jgi:hypothetical protein
LLLPGDRKSVEPMAARLAPNDVRRNAKHRWIIERDYEELKQELGLGHYEERGWRGFHHHATLCIAAYASFLRIAARIIVGVYLDVPYATLRRVGVGAPRTIQPFHAGELYHRKGAPDPLIAARP